MGKENTCCFTGHRNIPAEQMSVVSAQLHAEILQAISDGYTHFICGFAIGADLIFAELVAELKQVHHLTLEAAIPYPGRMKTPDETFQRLITDCDIVKTHSDYYYGGCYMKRNRYMVNQSSRIIAIYDGRLTGGTAATLKFAKTENCDVSILSLPMEKPESAIAIVSRSMES